MKSNETVMGVEMMENNLYVAVRFPSKPSETLIETMKFNRWRYSPDKGCWYHKGVSDSVRRFAISIVDRFNRKN